MDECSRCGGVLGEDATCYCVDVTLQTELEPVGELDIGLIPRFELASAPAYTEAPVHMLLTIAPRGPPIVDASTGPVAHVILALDVSASMNDPLKYSKLTEALHTMIYRLQAPDAAQVLVSVILFAYGAETIMAWLRLRSCVA